MAYGIERLRLSSAGAGEPELTSNAKNRMDDLVELLTVADHFQLEYVGLVVVPHLAPPDRWKADLQSVVIATPECRSLEATARLELWHFKIPDPARADERWRLVLS